MIILSSGIGNYVNLGKTRYSYFGGNNYLGLANHPELKKAAISAIEKYGVNFSASRVTTGTSDLHIELEKQLSKFKRKEDTILFPSGYQGNTILIRALLKPDSAVLIDSFAHPSIGESIRGIVNNIGYYDHCDALHLETLLKRLPGKLSPIIITDGIFSLTGEIAPLNKIYELAEQYNALIIVDDAHSTGILGQNGLGTPEHFNLENAPEIYQTETLSKALGSYGGFISANKELIELLRKKSDIYKSSTSLPPHVIAAGISSIRVITENPGLRIELINKASYIKKEITDMGFVTTRDNTPIIPIFFDSAEKSISLSKFLKNNDTIVSATTDYPNNMKKQIIRITASINHTDNQVYSLLELLKKWRNKNGTS